MKVDFTKNCLTNEIHLQKLDMWPVSVRVDYSPHHVDLAALTGGKYAELVNLVPWKVSNNKISAVSSRFFSIIYSLQRNIFRVSNYSSNMCMLLESTAGAMYARLYWENGWKIYLRIRYVLHSMMFCAH